MENNNADNRMERIKDGLYELQIDNQWFTIVGYSKSRQEMQIIPSGNKIDILTDGRKTIKLNQ